MFPLPCTLNLTITLKLISWFASLTKEMIKFYHTRLHSHCCFNKYTFIYMRKQYRIRQIKIDQFLFKKYNVLGKLFQYYYMPITLHFLNYHVEYCCTSHARVTHKRANLHVQVNWTMVYCMNFNYFIHKCLALRNNSAIKSTLK